MVLPVTKGYYCTTGLLEQTVRQHFLEWRSLIARTTPVGYLPSLQEKKSMDPKVDQATKTSTIGTATIETRSCNNDTNECEEHTIQKNQNISSKGKKQASRKRKSEELGSATRRETRSGHGKA